MTEERGGANWVGPVAGALILVGGYVGYQQWHEYHQRHQECAELKHTLSSNMDALMASSSVRDAIKEKSQLPMIGVAGRVAANQAVLDTLNAKCPGWVENQYK